MKFKPVICPISSGIKIIIREAHPGDALALTGCIQAYLKNQTIPLTKDEYQPSPGEQGKWISKFQEGQHDLLLVAEHEGRIIGNIDLSMHHRKMLSHTGYLGMGVHPDWQQKGIGKLLLEKLLEWSDNRSGIEVIWLQVFGNNLHAIKLYKALGFVEDGRQADFIKLDNGRYTDNVIMSRKK